MPRVRVATGIYRDAYGYEVRWREHGQTKSHRFPLDTPLDHVKDWRSHREKTAHRRAPKVGSFVRLAVRFLASRRQTPSWKSDRAHLRPWIHRFKALSPYAISKDQVQAGITFWAGQGYSPRELRHRWRILSQLLASLEPDGNPCRGVVIPKIQKTRARSVPDVLVREVALNLRKSEIVGRLRDMKTRARYLVLATTGQRPAQLRRATAADVDLERRIWFVEPAKGDNGALVYLNDDMLAAWHLFVASHAWGVYDGRSFVKTLRRNGWPKGIRPYNLRHTVGLSLSELGVDLGDIQAHMGHTSPATTRIYVPGVLSRLKIASEKLDGRFSLPQFSATTPVTQKAKDRQNPPHSTHGLDRPDVTHQRLNPRKQA